jgi:hypothetical protein
VRSYFGVFERPRAGDGVSLVFSLSLLLSLQQRQPQEQEHLGSRQGAGL